MSTFSEKLGKLVNECNQNIYQISKSSGLDRTTIQKTVKGERLPSITFLESLYNYLNFSPVEKAQLNELYTIEKVGNSVYEARKCIKRMIENIADLDFSSLGSFPEKPIVKFPEFSQEVLVFNGQFAVNNIIRELLENEAYNENSPHISIIAPFEFTFLFDCLKQLYWKSKGHMSIDQILCLSRNPHANSDSNINLNILSNVLPFAFCAGNGYTPSYYYGEDIKNEIALAMPYYFITSKALVTFSSDFTTAIIYTNKDMIATYSKHFQKCLSQTTQFIKYHATLMDILTAYDKSHENSEQITSVIEPQPCFAKYYTHKMIEEHLRQEIPCRELIKEYLYSFYDTTDYYKGVVSYSCAEGIDFFVQTGILADLPPQYATPFTIEERKLFLTSLRNDIANDLCFSRITNPVKFKIPSFAMVEQHANNGLIFIAHYNNDSVSSFINEQSISDAFFDFFESLQETDLVYSKDETIHILDKYIKQLEDMTVTV